MNYVGTTTIASWYGASCKVPISTVAIFGHDVPLHPKTHRLFKRLDYLFRTHARAYYYTDIIGDPIDTWGYACRPVRGSTTPSKHSFGVALDIEADENGMGADERRTEIWYKGSAAIKRAECEGFTWGGTFSRPDAMHFEVAVSPSWIRNRYTRNGEPRLWWKRKLAKTYPRLYSA